MKVDPDRATRKNQKQRCVKGVEWGPQGRVKCNGLSEKDMIEYSGNKLPVTEIIDGKEV